MRLRKELYLTDEELADMEVSVQCSRILYNIQHHPVLEYSTELLKDLQELERVYIIQVEERLRKKGDVLVCTKALDYLALTVGKEYIVLKADYDMFTIRDDEEESSYYQSDFRTGEDEDEGVLELKERS